MSPGAQETAGLGRQVPTMNAELHLRASRFNAFPVNEYNQYVAGHSAATPYHRSAWLQATEQAYGHTGWVISAHHNGTRSEEHTSELQSRPQLVCRLLLEKKKNTQH